VLVCYQFKLDKNVTDIHLEYEVMISWITTMLVWLMTILWNKSKEKIMSHWMWYVIIHSYQELNCDMTTQIFGDVKFKFSILVSEIKFWVGKLYKFWWMNFQIFDKFGDLFHHSRILYLQNWHHICHSSNFGHGLILKILILNEFWTIK
jgi:hypothetical protein